MARREFLSPAQRAQLLALPATDRELIRFYSLSPSELAWVRKRRGEHNRLGLALQRCFLNTPGVPGQSTIHFPRPCCATSPARLMRVLSCRLDMPSATRPAVNIWRSYKRIWVGVPIRSRLLQNP